MNRALATTAALLGDTSRAAIVAALISGVALPAGELAIIAGISAQTASTHLMKLVEGGVLQMEQSGRHRYYRLLNADVANAVEALSAIAPAKAIDHIHRDQSGRDLAFARTCYTHLAGTLAVAIASHLEELKVLVHKTPKSFALTSTGCDWLKDQGIIISDPEMKNPRFALRCLDWTERRYHISGLFGSLLFKAFLQRRWIATFRNSRAIRITPEGQIKLRIFVSANVSMVQPRLR